MIPQDGAQIFLSARRGSTHSQSYHSFHTLNFGSYQDDSRVSQGNLLFLNDDTLASSAVAEHTFSQDVTLLLLPLVGACRYHCGLDQGSLDVGQAHVLQVTANAQLEIINPYESEMINYLFIGFKHEILSHSARTEFAIDNHLNNLFPLFTLEQQKAAGIKPVWLGKFNGRNEGTYFPEKTSMGTFTFIIEGAFEFQNRLLQHRDGLALAPVREIEYEALSNEAIILVMEV